MKRIGSKTRLLRKPPVKLTVEDIDVDLIADFLVHTETARGNSARSRNTRLAAIRSFYRYVAMSDPTWLLHCQRNRAMPNKRYVKRTVIVDVTGDSIDPYALAGLLRIVFPSALPFRFGWAETCWRMRIDSFGGGFLEVSHDRIVPLHSLGQDLDRQHLVIVVKDPACGLMFWNNEEGFGPL